MESPYRDSPLQAVTSHEECTCAHACFACRTRVTKLAHEARVARARGRLSTIALLAAGVMLGAFICECTGLTAALERLTEATRQSNALSRRTRPLPTPASAPAPLPPLVPSPPVVQPVVLRERALIRWAIVRERALPGFGWA
jgi:hypothetical protein